MSIFPPSPICFLNEVIMLHFATASFCFGKDKCNLLRNDTKKSYVAECAIAILETRDKCCNKDEFIEGMEERGWHTSWTDNKKHITFQNDKGDKVRDSNISKTFEMDISKEALLYEFERQNEIRINRAKAERKAAELDKYYAEVESIQSNGFSQETVRNDTELAVTTDRDESKDTEALVREVRADILDNRTQNGIVIDSEIKSIAIDKQSHSRESERRFEEQQRTDIEERTRSHHSRSRGYSGPELYLFLNITLSIYIKKET